MGITKGRTEVVWLKPTGMTVPQERWPDAADDMELQFFDDRPAALHEMHYALVPHGRLRLLL